MSHLCQKGDWHPQGWRSPSFQLRKLLSSIVVFGLAIQLMLLTPQPAQAEPSERIFRNPPRLEFREESIAPLTLQAAPTRGGSKEFDLNIQYTEGKLYNPGTQTFDKVNLRSYVGTDTDPNRPYVAPLIEVEPGDTIRVDLNNQLPADPSCINQPKDVNIPHCFNGTNLHTHGLWISPTGNSDNVLLSINPGVPFQYEYNLPPDHPAGTFWYHPHRHGSTALQVSSGMAGALIVRGDRLPSPIANGDIDTLLKRPDGGEIPEKILVLQQIQYYCPDQKGNPKTNSDGTWLCEPGDVGIINSYTNLNGPGWTTSGRYTSINGEVLPQFSAKAGEIERWRMIHAGVADTISLEFRKFQGDASEINSLAAINADSYIEKYCPGDPLPYSVIADDGLTRAQAWQTTLTTLQPGYRSDALVVFPEVGQYCVVDTAAPQSGNVNQTNPSRQLLGLVKVEMGKTITPQPIYDYVTEQLVLAAQRMMPDSIKQDVIANLEDGLKFTKFIPHPDITSAEVKEGQNKQELAFNLDVGEKEIEIPPKFQIADCLDPKACKLQSYVPDHIDRELTLGTADQWTLESVEWTKHAISLGHPFHIHVNPFQIVAIFDPKGKDISEPCDPNELTCTEDDGDPQYQGLKGVWKDTIWIKGPVKAQSDKKDQVETKPYRIVVRTRYQRYIGEFVLHCHILDHEDQGMMQNVEIVLPVSAAETLN
ncbi:MAG: multicopper oxidase family protein [Cyanobacteria bacterium P01_G01_bin.54]